MELELSQLDLRYATLRRRSPEREKHILSSLAQFGQQTPVVVVVVDGGLQVVVDGYKRVRALKKLKADTVMVTVWELSECDALMLERLMRTADIDDAFEQGWLLRELQQRFGLAQDELSRRFDKSVSWVCRRLSLVQQLPEEIQERVRRGEIAPHAAMKYLVPLARANREASLRLVAALDHKKPSSRQVGSLYSAWITGKAKTRALLEADPWLYLRSLEESRRVESLEGQKNPSQQLLSDLGALAGICRRATLRLQKGIARGLLSSEREETHRCLCQAKADAETLFTLGQEELVDARPETTGRDSRPA